MNKLRFPVTNDGARNTTKSSLPSKPKKIKDFETLHDAKHSTDSSGVENTQL